MSSYTKSQKCKIFMEKFHARMDVYSKQAADRREDGKEKRVFFPICNNFWTDGCHIKLKTETPCSSCEIRDLVGVSEESVYKHISGEEFHMYYMMQRDNTIKFGVVDFDQKPGRESQGHDLVDVQRFTSFCRQEGIPYTLARSTGEGFHCYFFMQEFVEARYFHMLVHALFEMSGFSSECEMGIRHLPEYFPRSISIGQSINDFGTGIKPPMVETRFQYNRNCLVEDNGEHVQDQWGALDGAGLVSMKMLEDFMERNKEIAILPDNKKFDSGKRERSTVLHTKRGVVSGSIEKVVEGCQALSQLSQRMKTENYVPSHHEGMGLFMIAMNTLDGKDWFIKNVPGWGKNQKDLKQLEHSITKGYAPWSCDKFQEHGICTPGKKCFDKRPPYQSVCGQLVVDKDVPESEWPQPSPIRYATGKGEVFLKRLITEIDEACLLTDVVARMDAMTQIVKRSSVFDKDQQTILKDYLDSKKVYKKTDVNRMFNRANDEKQKQVMDEVKIQPTAIIVSNKVFRVDEPFGYSYLKLGGKNKDPERMSICNFCLDIEEERTIIDEGKVKKKLLFAKIRTPSKTVDFEISTNDWGDNTKTFQEIINAAGTSVCFSKQDMDTIRQIAHWTAVNGRAGVEKSKSTTYFGCQGWYTDAFVMPSVIVTKDGVAPNTDTPVAELKEHVNNLDFKIVPDNEFRDLLSHIKNDFINVFPRQEAMLCVGFAMFSSVFSRMGTNDKPVFWLKASTGTGKTAFAESLQCFYGEFGKAKNDSSASGASLSWQATAMSMLKYASDFKDCMMLVDDYKDMGAQQTIAQQLIQMSYGGSVRGAVTRDGEQRGDIRSRCLMLMTGEEFPCNHASIIARMFILEYPKYDVTKTTEKFDLVMTRKHDYNAITPKFIEWFLQQNRQGLRSSFLALSETLRAPIRHEPNAARISYNIAVALFGWYMFVDFLEFHAVATPKEGPKLKAEAYELAERARTEMVYLCQDETNINIFISRLNEMLFTGEVVISGADFSKFMAPNAPRIGFCLEKDPDHFYLHPQTTLDVVKRAMKNPLVLSQNSAGNLLKERGYLAKQDGDDTRNTVVKRDDRGNTARVWRVKRHIFGVVTAEERAPHLKKVLPKIDKDSEMF